MTEKEIKQFKVLILPARGEPDSIYYLKTGPTTADQFITDSQGNFVKVEGGGGPGGVTSVNNRTGAVVLTTNDIAEGVFNKYYNTSSVITDVTGLNISTFNNNAGYITSASIPITAYTHVQGVPAEVWIVTHNLGFKANVTVVDSTDRTVIGDIQYNTNNQLTLSFMGAFSGKAYLS